MNATASRLLGLACLLCALEVRAGDDVARTTTILMLGDTPVRVNVYEKPGVDITFVALHFDEQTANRLAREFIASNGGRLVELESLDLAGHPSRRLLFRADGRMRSIDPNRIFTGNGRACDPSGDAARPQVRRFADEFLDIALGPGGTALRDGQRFLVAVHNNVDSGSKRSQARRDDLTVASFMGQHGPMAAGPFHEQADGVYLSSAETDEDNFVFLSSPAFADDFIAEGFNVVVQAVSARTATDRCPIDDGSLSVYSAQHDIPYICLEADGTNGWGRQKRMFDSVLRLFRDHQDSALPADANRPER